MMVTGQSVITGTPQYMAPEAIRGEQFVDGRSDIYALGGVGIFLLTGEPVFAGQNLVEVVAHHLHTQPVPPSQRGVGQVPSDVEAVLMRCLEKQPEARFDSARDLGVALASCVNSSPWSLDRAAQFWTDRRGAAQRAPSRPRSSSSGRAAPNPGHAGDFDRQVDGSIRDPQRLHHQPGSERVRHRGHEVLRAT